MAALAEALGSALLHSLWQGSVIGLVAAVALWMLRGASAQARYLVASAMLAAMAGAFGVTLAVLLRPAPQMVFAIPGGEPATSIMPGIAWVWMGGALVMSARLMLQWRGVRRLRRDASDGVAARWRREFESLARELGMRRQVRLLTSTIADAPMVVGWLTPIVLMPVSTFTTLSPEQIRAVMAHELAHIRRFDHLVNALQSVIEIVLFFHPAVWWLSSRVRLEREHCCDDVAVRATGPVALARALSELETLRDAHPQMALAANGGTLMHRITRILGVRQRSRPRLEWHALAGLTAAAVLGVAGMSHALAAIDQPAHLTQSLRDAISVGAISEEKAREIYLVYLYPGSDMEKKIDTHIAMMETEIQAALEAGKISPADAREKRDAMKDRLALAKDVAFSMDVKGLTHDEAYLGAMAVKIHEQLERGEITKEEATKRIHEIKAKRKHTVKLREHNAKLSEHISVIHAEMKARVEAGELSEEEAKAQLHEQLRRIEAEVAAERKQAAEATAHLKKLSQVELEARRLKVVQAIEAEIAAMVEAGEISVDEAKIKLDDLRRERQIKQKQIDESVFEQAAAFKAAVKAGEMTREEAEAALIELMRLHEEKLAAEKAKRGTIK